MQPRLTEISDAGARLANHSVGRLMFDPIVPQENLAPIVDAFSEAHLSHTVTLVEGYLRPVLQTRTQRLIGSEAIVGYIKSFA